jgi:hypothetical protein
MLNKEVIQGVILSYLERREYTTCDENNFCIFNYELAEGLADELIEAQTVTNKESDNEL